MATKYNKVTHCIFDMDGLLLDTEKLYAQATQTILDKYGKTYTWEVKVSVMGLHNKEVSKKIVAAYDLPMTWQEYAELQKQATEGIMIDAQLMPDTEPIYEEITRQIAQSVGRSFPQEVRLRMLGVTEQVSAQIAVEGCGMPITVNDYTERYKKLCYERLPDSQLLKGAERLLRYLHANKIPFCLATSSGEEMVNIKSTHHKELFKLFSHLVCGSTDPEVKQGKPCPDIFLVAASRFPDKPDPAKCLVFEDAPNGVQAAYSACMQSVMVPDERVSKNMCEKATIVLKSLEDFKPEEFGLPPFA